VGDRRPHSALAALRACHTGTVEVRCEPAGSRTRAHVTYDLTALADPAALDRFAHRYHAMLADWQRLIAGAIRARSA
jgi:hypothetical protein